MSYNRLRCKADPMLSTPPTPIQILHKEEIILGHKSNIIDKWAGHQHARPTDCVDASEYSVRGHAASPSMAMNIIVRVFISPL